MVWLKFAMQIFTSVLAPISWTAVLYHVIWCLPGETSTAKTKHYKNVLNVWGTQTVLEREPQPSLEELEVDIDLYVISTTVLHRDILALCTQHCRHVHCHWSAVFNWHQRKQHLLNVFLFILGCSALWLFVSIAPDVSTLTYAQTDRQTAWHKRYFIVMLQ